MSSAPPKSGDVTMITIISTSDSQYHPQSASLAFHQNERHTIFPFIVFMTSCLILSFVTWLSSLFKSPSELLPWRKMSSIGSHRLYSKLHMLLDWVYDKLVGPWPMNHTFQIWHISLNDERKFFLLSYWDSRDIREWEKLAHPKCCVFETP